MTEKSETSEGGTNADEGFDAVIFDMDGVIVDSEEFWPEHQLRILEEALKDGSQLPETSRFTGVGIGDEYDYLVENHEVVVSRDEYFELYNREADVIYGEKADMIDGFEEALEYANSVAKTALCSSSLHSWIDTVLSKFSLGESFEVVVSDEDISKEGKPAPHIYLHTASLLEVEPERCIVIEDSEHGVKSAKNAGMYCIGFKTESNTRDTLSEADEVVEGHRDLRGLLEKLV